MTINWGVGIHEVEEVSDLKITLGMLSFQKDDTVPNKGLHKESLSMFGTEIFVCHKLLLGYRIC